MTLDELADACEAATGPDRELDMLIDCGLKGIEVVYPTEGHPMTPGRGGRIESRNDFRLLGFIDPGESNRNFTPYGGDDAYPKFTASLDAAMTLVPAGYGVYTRWSLKGGETRSADAIFVQEQSCALGENAHYTAEIERFEANAATVPLALTAAALRSHAQMKEDGR